MKKTIKRVTASLTAMLMLFGSTYTAIGSASATNNEIQLRKRHLYGDVNNDSVIDMRDAVRVAQCLTEFGNATEGATRMPLEYAEAKIGEFFLEVPQAADIDGDGYITRDDQQFIQYYEIKSYDKAGRCGQPFYINE